MVSDFIKDRINAAHAMIDEGYYEESVDLLKNIKHRVHETSVLNEINRFEEEHDKKLKEMIQGIKTSSDDPLRKQRNEIDQWKKYAQSYLKFYDRLAQQHDI